MKCMSPRPETPEVRRFKVESRVIKDADCWRFDGYHLPSGYAIAQSRRYTARVHRAMYEWYVGPIPDGMQLDHLCRNRWCVNPAHLELVTNGENARRGARDRTECQRGHDLTLTDAWYLYDGKRQCRQCTRERQRRNWIRNGDKMRADQNRRYAERRDAVKPCP